MVSMLFFCVVGGVLWVYSSSLFLAKDVVRSYALIMVFTSFLCFGTSILLLRNNEDTSYLYLFFIPLFIFSMFYIKKRKKVRGLEIVADQQRYWDEITSDEVYDFFKHRKINKGKRFAVEVNEQERKFHKAKTPNSKNNVDNYISVSFWKRLKKIENEFTFVENIEQIEEYPLYHAVFNKIKDIIKSSEKKVNYDEILKENNYIVEFFLLYLWENYTQRINISNANLILLAENEIQEDFVGAMDNVDLNSVKKRGAALYFRYIVYHKREGNYIDFALLNKQQDEPEENNNTGKSVDI
ncbi:hypothetical protein ACMWEF_001850 [Campylobacter jejuni]|nr:hypothetical protein [Campylobacter jejuni]EAJ2975602.1 hypothetical protein [Campylobacter jejuni]ECP7577922.1 hypothetical protein [Campylobacter jejuni]EDP2897539.1 hypothetical protein [Campylobacter jejuni]EGA8608807.1 hypothetical protein [Campylobacter jejuni]EGA8646604.1 hypothetical protein [Campylobacter jejuni]